MHELHILHVAYLFLHLLHDKNKYFYECLAFSRLLLLRLLWSKALHIYERIRAQLCGISSKCRNLKKKFRDKYGITDNIFDGSFESM